MSAREVKPEEYFYLVNGAVIKSLEEFPEAVRHVDDATFRYHASSEKNDFANWVKGVFKEDALSGIIIQAGGKKSTAKAVQKFLERRQRRLETMPATAEVHEFTPLRSHELVPAGNAGDPITSKLNEILSREKEIERRETIIQKAETELEERFTKAERRFFTKEFIEGILTGILITLIAGLVYFKFF